MIDNIHPEPPRHSAERRAVCRTCLPAPWVEGGGGEDQGPTVPPLGERLRSVRPAQWVVQVVVRVVVPLSYVGLTRAWYVSSQGTSSTPRACSWKLSEYRPTENCAVLVLSRKSDTVGPNNPSLLHDPTPHIPVHQVPPVVLQLPVLLPISVLLEVAGCPVMENSVNKSFESLTIMIMNHQTYLCSLLSSGLLEPR